MSKLITNWRDNGDYFEMLQLIGQLSNLFSASKIPYVHYRLAENLFCRYFNATNLSRSDISYDALYDGIGVGIKTFQLNNSNCSVEKVAEFNQLSSELHDLKGIKLARKVSEFRNNRIALADSLCGIDKKIYHIVGRRKGELIVFNTSYDEIDIENICDVKRNKDTSVSFNDGLNEYTFNYSKSVLMKRFYITDDCERRAVEIIDDPYTLLENLFEKQDSFTKQGEESVLLPLYSERKGGYVPLKSGLNQWNASGRKRDSDEVYIAVPAKVHQLFPGFFPGRDTRILLHLPDGKIIDGKMCQDGVKSIMSRPNKALGHWILRDLMHIPEGKLVTIEDLHRLGFDSLLVTKIDNLNYKLSVSYSRSYSDQ